MTPTTVLKLLSGSATLLLPAIVNDLIPRKTTTQEADDEACAALTDGGHCLITEKPRSEDCSFYSDGGHCLIPGQSWRSSFDCYRSGTCPLQTGD